MAQAIRQLAGNGSRKCGGVNQESEKESRSKRRPAKIDHVIRRGWQQLKQRHEHGERERAHHEKSWGEEAVGQE